MMSMNHVGIGVGREGGGRDGGGRWEEEGDGGGRWGGGGEGGEEEEGGGIRINHGTISPWANVSLCYSTVASTSALQKPAWAQHIPGGGAFFCRWNRRQDGSLFRNLFVLRQIWIGDRTYIVALQTELKSDPELVPRLEELAWYCERVSLAIKHSLPGLESALTMERVVEGGPQD